MPKHIVAVLGCTVAVGLCASPALAQSPTQNLPNVEVQQKKTKPAPARAVNRPAPPQAAEHAHHREEPASAAPAASTTLTAAGTIAAEKPATNDTATLLGSVPGVSLYGAGGVSSLPAIHGLNDDRLRTELNGMLITAACANHMNPILSYVDPSAVKQVQVLTGIVPVSAGGDAIGGSILVENAAPRFAAPGEGAITYGSFSVFGRSNGGGVATSGTLSAATSNVNITYNGAWSRSNDLEDGHGNKILSTLYEAQNHTLSAAVKGNNELWTVEGGIQHIPYQGFPNQWMDMTLNNAWFVNTRYQGQFGWGKLDARAFYQDTRHEMNFLADKGGPAMQMPMDTHGVNFGYSIKAEMLQSPRDLVRVGNEFHGYHLDDWWPPVGMMPGMMCCDTYWNINDGSRNRVGTFAEWEHKWTPAWTTVVGARNDIVWMDTGNVQAYYADPANPCAFDPMNPDAAAACKFNSRSHARTDINFDMTALARFEPDSASLFEGGYSRKTRSPNLYERYAWGESAMAMEMIGWFGDGNGYVGNLDLKPEVAHTLSFTAGWHDSARRSWELKITPYYSYVQDYIGVTQIGIDPMFHWAMLQFVNRDAILYGADISGRAALWDSYQLGHFAVAGVAGYVHGAYTDGGSLYHMMPINAKLALEQKLGSWTNAIETQLVGAKTEVDQQRLEPTTPAYVLVNLRTSYEWANFRFDAGVKNLFDKFYYEPLGGINIGDVFPGTGDRNDAHAVPGFGRTVYAGVTVRF